MKLKKFLTVFVSLLTVVSMLFSTAVTASADKGDRGRSPSKTHSYIRNNSQENDNDQGNNNNNPNNDQGNNNNNPSNDQGNNNANNDQGGQQQEQSQNTTANKISLYSDIPSYLGSGNDECTIHFLLIDSDEANACCLSGSQTARMRVDGTCRTGERDCLSLESGLCSWEDHEKQGGGSQAAAKQPEAAGIDPELKLVTEETALRLAAGRTASITLPAGVILTPSAKDVFLHAGLAVSFA